MQPIMSKASDVNKFFNNFNWRGRYAFLLLPLLFHYVWSCQLAGCQKEHQRNSSSIKGIIHAVVDPRNFVLVGWFLRLLYCNARQEFANRMYINYIFLVKDFYTSITSIRMKFKNTPAQEQRRDPFLFLFLLSFFERWKFYSKNHDKLHHP